MSYLWDGKEILTASELIAKGAVEKTIQDYGDVVESLQRIARQVLKLRNELDDVGHQGATYVPRDSVDFTVNLDSSTLVEASYYFAHEDRYFNFPLSYAWLPDFVRVERIAIAKRKAAEEAKRQKETDAIKQNAEAHERALYHTLHAKYGPRFEAGSTFDIYAE